MTNTNNLDDTYPPFFRQNRTVDHVQEEQQEHEQLQQPAIEDVPKSLSKSDSDSFPILDFQLMNREKLNEICREWGMFRLVNHGVPEKLLNQLLEVANKLFSLSFEIKQELFADPILYFWGSPALTMSGNAANQTGPNCLKNLNWLEGFNVPLSKTWEFHYEDPLIESFRSLLEEYGNHQARVAKSLFRTMAEDLNFCPTKSESYLSLPTGFLRVYRYLSCPMTEERWGIDVHTDSSVLTILHQDEVGGLQVHKNSEWLDVNPVPNTLIVNIGDMMQAMSDDNYTSAKHRVRVHRKKERVSVGYFVFPDEGAVVESSRYKPFTYADFQATKELDLRTVGKKIGLPRFRISDN